MRIGDAYGEMLLAALDDGGEILEIVEREDGFIMASSFGPAATWLRTRSGQSHQQRGNSVRARTRARRRRRRRPCRRSTCRRRGTKSSRSTSSPGAIEACRRRGIRDARVMRIEDVDESLGVFDTVVMYGNNLALLASRTKAPRILRRLARITSQRARIIGECLDPYTTDNPAISPTTSATASAGRMGGQLRIRVRYHDIATPWFDYIFLSEPRAARRSWTEPGWELPACWHGRADVRRRHREVSTLLKVPGTCLAPFEGCEDSGDFLSHRDPVELARRASTAGGGSSHIFSKRVTKETFFLHIPQSGPPTSMRPRIVSTVNSAGSPVDTSSQR